LYSIAEGSPQTVELKEEIVRLANELHAAKQKNFQDLQLLGTPSLFSIPSSIGFLHIAVVQFRPHGLFVATTMAARNAEYAADLSKLQSEYSGLSLPASNDPTPDTPKRDGSASSAPSRGRSTSFAQKVKGLFSGSKKAKKEEDSED
jgi:hypothetical protein